MILNIERMIADVVNDWQQSNKGQEVKNVLISSRLQKEYEIMSGEPFQDFNTIKILTSDDLPLFGIEIITK